MKNNPSSIVLIPARNEEATVAAVVRRIRDEINCEVLVIDDGSSDRTIEMAQSEGATVLPLALRLGAWGAIQTGFRYALKMGYQIAVTMDADGQHPESSLQAILEPIESGLADVVIGACPDRASTARHMAWSLFRLISGVALEDLTSGFRAYNQISMSLLASRRATLLDYQDMGVLLLLKRAGLRIMELPVGMLPRETGHSRVFSSWWVVAKYMVATGVLCLAKRDVENEKDNRSGNSLETGA